MGEPTQGDTKRIGKYQLEQLLGTGTFGEVYRATDTTLNRVVALKLLKGEIAWDAEGTTRFLREAQVAANLFHPQIALVYDAGPADGRYYIAMRYVDGPSLHAVIRE